MSALSAVLDGTITPGVHRCAIPLGEVRAEVEAAGWTCAYVDGRALAGREAVLLAMGEALGFPSYFTGRSLDALNDCLRDVSSPTVLAWDGWGVLAAADPVGLRGLLTVLADRASAAAPALEVLLLGDGPADVARAL